MNANHNRGSCTLCLVREGAPYGRIHEDSDVRSAAVAALKNRAHFPYQMLLLMLGDSSDYVRRETRAFFNDRAPEVLLEMCYEAINILLNGTHRHILGSLIQGHVAEVIGNLGILSTLLLERLEQLLGWPYWQVQVEAIEAFGKIKRNIPDMIVHRLFEKRHSPICVVALAENFPRRE